MATYQHTVALFKEYKAENDKRKIVELLESFLRECPDADDMQICWAFWNLSDNYAMLGTLRRNTETTNCSRKS